jgi:hypothetical protein
MSYIKFNNSYNASMAYSCSISKDDTLYFPQTGNAILFNGKHYGFRTVSGPAEFNDATGNLSVKDITGYNNANIKEFSGTSLTITPGDVYIYNGNSGLSNLTITINNSSLLLSHYKIIVKTGASTANEFLSTNYSIMLPPSCSNKLDANSIYEIDLELVKVAGSYNLLGVISKFS